MDPKSKDVTPRRFEIENDLLVFVMKQCNKEDRSFTKQLNFIIRNEKNRMENRERNDNG